MPHLGGELGVGLPVADDLLPVVVELDDVEGKGGDAGEFGQERVLVDFLVV
ncbi:hypothetical protein [Streptomyces sp. NPDC051546]|uniref:hypothetical protein n=1 Tax=Streptomyces sp. NPDC051546 TaxID=3365655 RepID=UPI0037991FBB